MRLVEEGLDKEVNDEIQVGFKGFKGFQERIQIKDKNWLTENSKKLKVAGKEKGVQ